MSENEVGIRKLLGLHYYVHDLERSRRFYMERLGFAEIGCSSPALEQEGRQRSLVFQADDIVIACSTPQGVSGRAARYLSRHPDGIGTLAFEVDDIAHTFRVLEARGATPIGDIMRDKDAHGTIATFSITTPFGDTTFRFVERQGYRGLFPGMQLYDAARGGNNPIGFTNIDHVTSNFQTMAPALLWLEHVLGLRELWEVEFHTRDVAKYEVRGGSGLRSKVMWDPKSRIKFANNEPYRPSFRSSQINQFVEDHRGDGIQHVALVVPDIISAVRSLRERGLEFMPTPSTYYEALPERLAQLGIARIDEPIETLRELEILVDGHGPGRYLLQIFVKDSAAMYKEAPAGPFFFELIQRKGDEGFGAGNFRALFESIERSQGGGAKM
ncbi:MAG TPA: 4-hydroxyphenylpyruvate dioxygenase [Polyangiales bacterium]|nr:4-hydroxyphenylpyruvate dioxygenase [Polyangiales bacterium]